MSCIVHLMTAAGCPVQLCSWSYVDWLSNGSCNGILRKKMGFFQSMILPLRRYANNAQSVRDRCLSWVDVGELVGGLCLRCLVFQSVMIVTFVSCRNCCRNFSYLHHYILHITTVLYTRSMLSTTFRSLELEGRISFRI